MEDALISFNLILGQRTGIISVETDHKDLAADHVAGIAVGVAEEKTLPIPLFAESSLNTMAISSNGTKKDATIKLSKNSLMWPIIVIATDIERIDRDFVEQFDSIQYDEIVHRYKETIDSCCERVEYFTKILYDFVAYKNTGKSSEKTINFVAECWQNYSSEFEADGMDAEMVEALTKVVVYNVIRRRYDIDKIKKGVAL